MVFLVSSYLKTVGIKSPGRKKLFCVFSDTLVVRNELEKKEEKDYKGQEEERGCGVGGLMGNGRGRMATVDGASI